MGITTLILNKSQRRSQKLWGKTEGYSVGDLVKSSLYSSVEKTTAVDHPGFPSEIYI